jgi:hypothetical protein
MGRKHQQASASTQQYASSTRIDRAKCNRLGQLNAGLDLLQIPVNRQPGQVEPVAEIRINEMDNASRETNVAT